MSTLIVSADADDLSVRWIGSIGDWALVYAVDITLRFCRYPSNSINNARAIDLFVQGAGATFTTLEQILSFGPHNYKK